MAIQAPAHGQRLRLDGPRHLLDTAVAGLAGDALGDVSAMMEIGIVRQAMDRVPWDGLVELDRGAQRFEHARPRPDLRVTAQARGRRRHARRRRPLDASMTVTAVDAKRPGVNIVAERDR